MKSGIDKALLESGGLIKRGKSVILENAGKTIAFITGAIAVLVTFTEIGFYDFRTVEFITNVLVLLAAAYIIYFSLEDAGERLGRDTSEYRENAEKYDKALAELSTRDICELREFLERYAREEMIFRRRAVLMRYGISYSEFEDYLDCGKIPKKYRRGVRRAKRVKAHHLSPKLLFSRESRGAKSELYNPEYGKIPRLALGLVPSAVCMLFTVSVMLGLKDGMTPAFISESVLKLSALPIIGIRGYSRGWRYAKDELSLWVRTKTSIIEAFLKETQS